MSRPRGATPPGHVVNRLAADWRAVAIHEAGHVVAALSVGLPVHEVWMIYREHTRWFAPSDWSIVARTEVAPNGGTVAGQADQAIVMILGGLLAETMTVARRDGRSHGSAWRIVTRKDANHGDMSDLRSWLRDDTATLTSGTAERLVKGLLRDRWSTVISVANALAVDGRLRESQVRRLAGTPAGPIRTAVRLGRGGGR